MISIMASRMGLMMTIKYLKSTRNKETNMIFVTELKGRENSNGGIPQKVKQCVVF